MPRFPNLAGDSKATVITVNELNAAEINLVTESKPLGEPGSLVSGWLGNFTFERAWYYWRINGPTPLDMVRELYDDVQGKCSIRVKGNCGHPAPEEPYIEYFNKDGDQVYGMNQLKEWEFYANSEGVLKDIATKAIKNDIFHKNPSDVADPYIMSYDIDSSEGLLLFTKTLHKYNLVPGITNLSMDANTLCNRKACREPGAICWNYHTHAFYCRKCAMEINIWLGKDMLEKIHIPNTETMKRLLRP